MSKRRSIAAALLAACCATAHGADATWADNGHRYQTFAIPDRISWTQADTLARAAGGSLVTITSEAENAFVYSLIQSDLSLWNDVGSFYGPWIGAQRTSSGTFAWVTGEAFNYTSWRTGEPNNSGGTENFVHFIGCCAVRAPSPFWNDFPVDGTAAGGVRGYVVEFNVASAVPEPGTAALLMAGFVGLATVRARRIGRLAR